MGSDCTVPDHCLSFYFTLYYLEQYITKALIRLSVCAE